jgi:succinate dehydrogenase/fumarate reductase flavoprotein subunit
MKLKMALQWVQRFKKNDVKELKASDAHELGRVLEIQSILDCVEMAARASLERTESRWSFLHQRTDFPKKDDAKWLKKIIIKKNKKTGKMVLAIRRFT